MRRGPTIDAKRPILAGTKVAASSALPMDAETDPDFSPKVRCPTCGVTQARTLLRSAPIAYVRCGACGTVWSVLDRRGRYPSRHPDGKSVLRPGPPQDADESTDGQPSDREILWRVGAFVCELRGDSDQSFPAVLCVSKDGEPVLEMPVLSALEAEERAHGLRLLVERHHSG